MNLKARLSFQKKDSELAHHCSNVLKGLGFVVLKEASRGIYFQGEKDLFEKAFSRPVIESEAGIEFKDSPQLPNGLDENSVSVYFPTQVTFFK